ncbi:MAG: ribosome small subunit-dependent GTPase A [Lachnospiraceae bacterium]
MSSKTLNGILLKGIGGFYSVEAADAVYICKARGVFRKKRITPLSGDRVQITVSDSDAENTIDEILPRKNELRRPPVANIDNLIIVVSTTAPRPSPFVIDKLIALAEQKEIEPIVVFTKTDIVPTDTLFEVYRKAGIPCFAVSNQTGDGVEAVRALLHGKIRAFTGNSGVGKTSLLNRIAPNLRRETGEISDKLGRGRHTTRQAELFSVCGGYVVDTPGFSSLDFERADMIRKEDLAECFREFRPYLGACKFTTCSHTCDKGCAVLAAVERGEISTSRHNSYTALYNAVKDWKEWES